MEKLLAFLRDLERNNNREWFNDNKERYGEVLKIWYDFCEELLTSSLFFAIRWRTMIISELRRIIGWFWVAQAKKCISLHHVRT